MTQRTTAKIFLLLSLLAMPAYAQEWVSEARVAPIIRKEREKVGERIYGLDNMIAPSARRMALEVSEGVEQKPAEAYFPSSIASKRMNEEANREIEAQKVESEREEAVRREIAREEFLREKADREDAAREAARIARQGQALESFPGRGAEKREEGLPDSYYEQRQYQRPAQYQNPAPIQTFQQMGRPAPIVEPSIGQRLGMVVEAEPEPEVAQAAPKKYGHWDRPMPERKSIPMPVQEVRPPSRLTEAAPSQVSPLYVTSGYWDELNAARERARQAVAESVQLDESVRPAPVNLPTDGYGRPLSANWKQELAQVESVARRDSPQKKAAQALAPQQAGLGPMSFIPYGKSAGGDALADEVKEVEQSAGFGTQRLLANIQTEHGTNEVRGGYDSEDVPLLRPRYRTSKKLTRKQRRALAKALAKNGYARGSRPNEMVREGESTYEAAQLRPSQPSFYRHLNSDLPSKPRGKNIRTHSVGDPEE